MKAFLVGLLMSAMAQAALASGSMVGGGDSQETLMVTTCSVAIAMTRAVYISDTIAAIDGFDLQHASTLRMDESGDYYMVTRMYDSGLSVPAYTVKLSKSNCTVLDIKYSNFEG